MIREYCVLSDNTDDLFVGIRFRQGVPEVVFPYGYAIAEDDVECRKDIFRLLGVLSRFSDRDEGNNLTERQKQYSTFPLTSYQYIIQDYLQNGYYIERESYYTRSQRGKISWKRTIQQEDPHVDGNNIVYLDYRVKTNQVNMDNLITHIHRYCVYQSFYRFGWLYFNNDYLPEESRIPYNEKLFISTLSQALANTYNDSKRLLYQSMINIVSNQKGIVDIKNMEIGVNRFDPVWERIVDYIFGENGKNRYFPHATWSIIKNGKIVKSSALEPDTIMKHDGKIFVLDAKYYKFGITEKASDLPQTSSIQKQITYGKHIAEHMNEVPIDNVFNAFIMPFNATDEHMVFVSVGTADWEEYQADSANYIYVLGILLDTRWAITQYIRHNDQEIERLANLIESSLSNYKRMV